MKKILQLMIIPVICALTACASVSTAPQVSKGKAVKPAATAAATTTVTMPVVATAPDLTAAKQSCDTLKAQFQTQLPFQLLSQLQWNTLAVLDPTQPAGPMFPACQVDLHTDGLTIEKLGLTPNFVTATLERLDWQPGPSNYAADSATGHQEAMITNNQLAIINYTFAPVAGACPSNKPISACKVPRKKWDYQLRMIVLAKPEAPAVPK